MSARQTIDLDTAHARLNMLARSGLVASALLAGASPVWAEPLCTAGPVRVSADFACAGRHACMDAAPGSVTLSVKPENKPINKSPWYAFKLETDVATQIRVTLAYDGADHRYHPKWTTDGRTWKLLPSRHVEVDDQNDRATLTLDLPAGMTVVAAQAIETPDAMLGWARAALSGFEENEYGKSIDGRPLIAFRAGGESGDGLVVALTRQHPPETTGAAAFRAFAEKIAADTPQARAFRAGHRVLLAPMTNPDGVMRGHWRHNAGGVDLNRDWGPFTQPETRSLARLIEAEAKGRRVVAFFDFHSTDRTVTYAPPRESSEAITAFLTHLRAHYEAHLKNPPKWSYGAKNPGAAKNWALSAFNAPGMTIELDDAVPPTDAHNLGEATAVATISYFAGARP
jgi:murein tripeptide amidase MpaA